MMRLQKGAFLFLLILIFSSPAFGFDFTVTDSAGSCDADCVPSDCATCQNPTPGTSCSLQSALDIASCNGEGDTLQITAGAYDASGGNTFTYTANDPENFPLTLIGDPAGGSVVSGGGDSPGMFINISGLSTDDNADVTVRNLTFQDGSAGSNGGGGLNIGQPQDADITVDHCQFLNNEANSGDGGGLRTDTLRNSVTTISNNLFLDNHAISSDGGGDGGGVFAEEFLGTVVATNNIFSRNNADERGGGIRINVSDGLGKDVLTHNTLFNNTAGLDGGGIAIETNDNTDVINIFNNIVWGNTATGNGDDIWTCENNGTVNLVSNDFTEFFSDGTSNPATICGTTPTINNDPTNINQDPLFVNSGTDDFHLTAFSPAIDKGDPAPPAFPSTDFDGVTRPQLLAPDMGALEFIPTCGDGRIDAPEQCDPQNTAQPCATGTCNTTTCQCSSCGDGVVDPAAGEQCEPPNTATCDASCHLIQAACGNGVVETGETCDPPGAACGGLTDNDGSPVPGICTTTCQCIPNCVLEGSGCGDHDEEPLCTVIGGTTTGGASLVPVVHPTVLAQWLAAFAVPGVVFTGLRLRRRK